MRYSTTHKRETRERLLASSRAIAKQGGFDAASVDALMASIGLTGGAFYSHFPSKQALFEELAREELAYSAHLLGGDPATPDDEVARQLRRYLGTAHAGRPDLGCVLPTLGPEIARAGPVVRKSAEQSLKRVHKQWRGRLGDPDDAWSLLAQCVGALVLARAVESPAARRDILAACRRTIARRHAIDIAK